MALSWWHDKRKRSLAMVVAGLWVLELAIVSWYLLPRAGATPPTSSTETGMAAGAATVVAPSPTTTPTIAPTAPQTTGPASKTAPARSYPTTVDAYARAALNAWLAGGGGKLADLATAGAITSMGQVPSGLAGGWQFSVCRVAPIDPCRELRNANGDVFGVSIDRARLGKAKAVTAAYRDLTRYEGSALAYLYRGIDAWNAGNSQRIGALTEGTGGWIFTTISVRGDHTAFHDYAEFASTTDPANRTCLQAWDSTGTSWLWAVDKRRLGRAHAIVWAGAEQVC